jgi:curved DNA-binding protein CbpA
MHQFASMKLALLLSFAFSFEVCSGISISCYAKLGIANDSSNKDIRQAYRSLASKYHPDKMPFATAEEKKNAESSFIEVAKAYEVLSDPRVKKKRYDYALHQFGELEYQEGRDWTLIDQKLGIIPMHHRNSDLQPEKKGSRTFSFEEAERLFRETADTNEEQDSQEEKSPLYQAILPVVIMVVLIAWPLWLPSLKLTFSSAYKQLSKGKVATSAVCIAQLPDRSDTGSISIKTTDEIVQTKQPKKPKSVPKARERASPGESGRVDTSDSVIDRLLWISSMDFKTLIIEMTSDDSSSPAVEAACSLGSLFIEHLERTQMRADNIEGLVNLSCIVDGQKLRRDISGPKLFQSSLAGKSPMCAASNDIIEDFVAKYEHKIIAGDSFDRLKRELARMQVEEKKHSGSCAWKVKNNCALCSYLPRDASAELGGILYEAINASLRVFQDEAHSAFEKYFEEFKASKAFQKAFSGTLTLSDVLGSSVGLDIFRDHLIQEQIDAEFRYAADIKQFLELWKSRFDESVDKDAKVTEMCNRYNFRASHLLWQEFVKSEQYSKYVSESAEFKLGQHSVHVSIICDRIRHCVSTESNGALENDLLFMLNATVAAEIVDSFKRFKGGVVRVLGDMQPSKDFRTLEKQMQIYRNA